MKVNYVFDEIVDYLAGHQPEKIINFHPSEETQKRVELLLTKKHEDAGNGKHDKSDCCRPVNNALPIGKALYQSAAGLAAQFQGSIQTIKHGNDNRYEDQKQTANQCHRTIANLAPGLTCRLDQNARLPPAAARWIRS